jgi:hypothetical protein
MGLEILAACRKTRDDGTGDMRQDDTNGAELTINAIPA